MNIIATPATAVYYNIVVRQWNHQRITLTRMDTGVTTTTIFSVLEGTKILVEVTTDPDYIPGELNVPTVFNATENVVVTTTKPVKRV